MTLSSALHAEEQGRLQESAGDSLSVSLLTCSPGEEIYQYYGHTALLVREVNTGNAVVFNYGLFDFNTPFFMWRFLLGQTDYLCGACYLDDFLASYRRRGTEVREVGLNLTQEECARLYASLKENCRPENATYRYNFFYDNCATRVRDQIKKCLKERTCFIGGRNKKSLRQIVHEFSAEYKWSLFGQDLLLGAEADKPATPEIQEFAPMYLEEDIKASYVCDSVGHVRPLVSGTRILVSDEGVEVQKGFPLSPFAVSIILLIITIALSGWDIYRRRPAWAFDAAVLIVRGLAGALVTFMFFFSVHPTVDSNWQILLLNPLPLLFLYWVVRNGRRNERCLYHEMERIYLIVAVCVMKFIPQYISSEVYILALCLWIRSMSNHIIYTYRLRK